MVPDRIDFTVTYTVTAPRGLGRKANQALKQSLADLVVRDISIVGEAYAVAVAAEITGSVDRANS